MCQLATCEASEEELIPYVLSMLYKESIKGGHSVWNMVIRFLYSPKVTVSDGPPWKILTGQRKEDDGG